MLRAHGEAGNHQQGSRGDGESNESLRGQCGAPPPVVGFAVTGGVSIALTDAQVEQVLREAAHSPQLESLLPEVSQLDALSRVALPLLGDASYSRSALRALLVLNALPPDGSERELTDLARQLAISPSTTHRYMHTWMALGLVEQDPRSRRYHRTPASRTDRERAETMAGGSGAR
jgi:DNA-binding MarR family transcriptional regulator